MIREDDTPPPDSIVPMQGYPGHQKHRQCGSCGEPMETTEVIWESAKAYRLKITCTACEWWDISTVEKRMVRRRITVKR